MPAARRPFWTVAAHRICTGGRCSRRSRRTRCGCRTRHPDAADGWADALEAVVHADPRTRDSVWLGCGRRSCSAGRSAGVGGGGSRGGEGFDPARFLIEAGTLFLLAPATTSASSGPLVAAFVEDVTETARRLAAASIGARLDPPVLLALDEIANLTPLPSLPALMAEGGGSGITTMAVLQSLARPATAGRTRRRRHLGCRHRQTRPGRPGPPP